MGASLAMALKSGFTLLGCLVTTAIIYTIAIDGLPFRKQLLTPWLRTTLIDCYIHVFLIGCWVVYKESSWITATLWAVLLVCLGSIATCGYIVLQFMKLSPQESSEDPIYFVLLRRQKRTGEEQPRKSSLLTARILNLALGSLMLWILIYSFANYGSFFRRDVLTPWMVATLVNFFGNCVALSVWVVYKESSWLNAAFLIILINWLGSPFTCAYISIQLFGLSSQDPVHLILFRSSSNVRQVCGYLLTVFSVL